MSVGHAAGLADVNHRIPVMTCHPPARESEFALHRPRGGSGTDTEQIIRKASIGSAGACRPAHRRPRPDGGTISVLRILPVGPLGRVFAIHTFRGYL